MVKFAMCWGFYHRSWILRHQIFWESETSSSHLPVLCVLYKFFWSPRLYSWQLACIFRPFCHNNFPTTLVVKARHFGIPIAHPPAWKRQQVPIVDDHLDPYGSNDFITAIWFLATAITSMINEVKDLQLHQIWLNFYNFTNQEHSEIF